MHNTVFQKFDEIRRVHRVTGAVLEFGAVPAADILLALPALASAKQRIGTSLETASTFASRRILQDNARDLRALATATFDAVLCNSMLEHDGLFWLSLTEMRRVARPGALIVTGVPGSSASRFIK